MSAALELLHQNRVRARRYDLGPKWRMRMVRLTMCKSLSEGCADSAPSLMHRETDQDEL